MLTANQADTIYQSLTIVEAAMSRDHLATIQEQIAHQSEKRIEQLMKREFGMLAAAVLKHIKSGQITEEMIDTKIDWASFELRVTMGLRKQLEKIVGSAINKTTAYIGGEVSWNLKSSPEVVAWLDKHTAELVVQVSTETRNAIKSTIRDNYLNWIGTDTRTMAKNLRPIVGLTEYQSKVVANYRKKLEDAKAKGVYRSPKQIDQMVANKAESIKRYRCKMIAQTETNYAANQGALATYRVNPQVTALQWYVTSGTPCPECAALDGKIVDIDGAFAQVDVKIDGEVVTRDVTAPPLHPNCLIDGQVSIMTIKGWRPIKEVAEGDLILTHKGRYRKVTKKFMLSSKEHPVQQVTRISLYEKFHQKYSLSVTNDHPLLTGDGWKRAGDIRPGDKVVMLANECQYCGKPIHYLHKYCSKSCSSKATAEGQWERQEHRDNVSAKNREATLRNYALGILDPQKNTEAAHERTREMVALGEHPFQQQENKHKANEALGHNNYGGSKIELAMGEALTKLGLNSISQYPVKKEKLDALGRPRNYFLDFALPDKKIAIECDEARWHSDKEREQERQNELECQGWTVLHFSREQINEDAMACALEVLRLASNHEGKYGFVELEVKGVKQWELAKPRTLYNLSVEEDESYIANGFVSHNCGCVLLPVTVETEQDDEFWAGRQETFAKDRKP